ncbi:MAG: PucR family transcriptional regulator [Tractidigestivibacter sp.]|jgi:hypothetical protein|uniref:PucR family transcriptional regulator n=1 Tax=Tractidigestivibacter sp. TaxID=2847320 RepID=UPI003D8AABFE
MGERHPGGKPITQPRNDRVADAREAILDALLSGSLRRLVDSAAELLGNPVMVGDLSLTLVAHSPDHGETHDYWRRVIEIGYCDYENYEANRKAILRAMASPKPIVDRESCPDGAIVEAGIGPVGSRVGYMSVFECHKPVDDEDVAIVSLVARAIALLMPSVSNHEDVDSSEHEIRLLYRTASKQGRSAREAGDSLARALLIRSARHYFVVKIGSVDETSIALPSRLIRDEVAHALGNCGTFLTRNHLVAFAGSNEDDFLLPGSHSFQRLSELLSSNGLCAGVGYPYEKTSDFGLANFQAGRALSIGRKALAGSCLYRYGEVISLDFAEVVTKHRDPRAVIDPRLVSLASYDAAHQTDYLRSLNEFLNSGGSFSHACANLGVHRNTLVYRIDRIRDAFNIDARDVHEAALLAPCLSVIVLLAHGRLDRDGVALLAETLAQDDQSD